jgi:hypothetical protein
MRLRAFQLAEQPTFGTPVTTATRKLPWRNVLTVDPHWTTPDVDTGTLDPGLAPYRMALDATSQTTGPVDFNDAQILWNGFLKGGVSPSGGVAKTWQWTPASTSQDVYGLMSGQWGDEVAADQWGLSDGIIDQLTLTFPQDLGPIQHQATWRWGTATYPQAMTAGLVVSTAPKWAYNADTRLYIDSNAGAIGITPLLNTMHDASIVMNANTDVKRFANGSNTRFQVAGYGRGARTMETTFNLAKSTQALQEFADWLNASPVERFIALDTVSAEFVTGSTPFSQRIRWAGYWFTRTDGTVGNNTTGQLVCHHVYDANLIAPIDVRLVNAQATLAPAAS